MNALELFAGIGGLSLGLQRAGITVVGQVEIDPFCRSVLAKHWPEVPRHDDVRTALDWWTSEPRPRVDLVAGGYPCQPESTAGKRRGTSDERWLWPEFAGIVATLRPRYVLGENVMGHRTSGLRFVLADLEQLGYTARAGIVSAAEVGAPHRRQRIFVLAHADGGGLAQHPQRDGQPDARVEASRGYDAVGLRPDVADTGGEGLEGPGRLRDPGADTGRVAADDGWWAAEPDVGRVAHGIPGRVDRLRALGNAVVPQVAQFVAHLLLSERWLADD